MAWHDGRGNFFRSRRQRIFSTNKKSKSSKPKTRATIRNMEGLRNSLSRQFSMLESKEDDGDGFHLADKNGPFKFVDVDMLESGTARETMTDMILSPASTKLKKLYKCHVVREGKTKFWMYCESTNGFLLSAKLVGTTFYISQYEEFPSTFRSEKELASSEPGVGATFSSVVRLNPKTKAYTLYNRMCEACDDVMGLHTCGAQMDSNGDRQVLAQIRHKSEPIRAGYDQIIDCNVVDIKVPSVHHDLSRDVWCSRFRRDGMYVKPRIPSFGRSRPRLKMLGSKAKTTEDDSRYETCSSKAMAPLKRGDSEPNVKIGLCSKKKNDTQPLAGDKNNECHLTSRRPRFDKNTGSLRMKFLNNRVRMASSKNLIFCLDKASDNLTTAPVDAKNSSNEGRVALQFGKYSDERFNLDYAFPLAPVQAFGIALSLFNWQGGSKN
mmetsp:Transcript_15165/g.24634  ORF Transcript_15165/g.24634 Transcript_15165/m.24634 type:complete len:437 (+) Transcript_15165:1033-2343(+)